MVAGTVSTGGLAALAVNVARKKYDANETSTASAERAILTSTTIEQPK
jgi:hypothetical protein